MGCLRGWGKRAMGQDLFNLLFWPLIATPWLSILLGAYLAFRGRWIWAVLLMALSCFGSWIVLFAFTHHLENGSIDAGPAFALSLALDYAAFAFLTGLAVTVALRLWRWIQRRANSARKTGMDP